MADRPNLAAAQAVCDNDIIPERWRQLKKWGVQSHPDGTNPHRYDSDAEFYTEINDWRVAHHEPSPWSHILLEEVFEAMCETEPEPLRTELIQVAAVCVAWVEDLDRRQFARVTEAFPLKELEGVTAE